MKYFLPFRREVPDVPEPDLLTDLSRRATELRAERFRVDLRLANDSARRDELDVQIDALDSAVSILTAGTRPPQPDGVLTLLRPVDGEWEVPLAGLLDQLDLADGGTGDGGGDHLPTGAEAAPEGALPHPEQEGPRLRAGKKRLTLPRVDDMMDATATPTETPNA